MDYNEMVEFVEGAGALSDDNQEIYDEINPMVEEIREDIEELKNWEFSEDEYDEFLDDLYPEYDIGGMKFYASNILKKCDPIAYNIGFGEEEDYQREQRADEIASKIDELENCFDEEIVSGVVFDLRKELNEAW